jgi:quercetin dioxygenase-like cupin family protein
MTPEVGLELVNPVAGTRMVFLATAASSNGEYVEIEATYPPNNAPPPRHLHPNQDERFELISGSLRGVRGDEEFAVSKGEELEVPRGTPHLMGAGDDGAVFRWRTSPALRRTSCSSRSGRSRMTTTGRPTACSCSTPSASSATSSASARRRGVRRGAAGRLRRRLPCALLARRMPCPPLSMHPRWR